MSCRVLPFCFLFASKNNAAPHGSILEVPGSLWLSFSYLRVLLVGTWRRDLTCNYVRPVVHVKVTSPWKLRPRHDFWGWSQAYFGIPALPEPWASRQHDFESWLSEWTWWFAVFFGMPWLLQLLLNPYTGVALVFSSCYYAGGQSRFFFLILVFVTPSGHGYNNHERR